MNAERESPFYWLRYWTHAWECAYRHRVIFHYPDKAQQARRLRRLQMAMRRCAIYSQTGQWKSTPAAPRQ